MKDKKMNDEEIQIDQPMIEMDGEGEMNLGMVNASVLEYIEKIESRRIYLFGDINKENILSVIYQIHMLEKKSDEDIELYINSDGGYVLDCFALLDVMDASPCDFKVIVLGLAASAACLIASNGTPGKRYAGRFSEFMFHEVMGGVPSNVTMSDFPYIMEDTKRIQNKANKIFSKNTGQSIQEIEEFFYNRRQDRYMTAAEAKKFKIIDKIIPVKKR